MTALLLLLLLAGDAYEAPGTLVPQESGLYAVVASQAAPQQAVSWADMGEHDPAYDGWTRRRLLWTLEPVEGVQVRAEDGGGLWVQGVVIPREAFLDVR